MSQQRLDLTDIMNHVLVTDFQAMLSSFTSFSVKVFPILQEPPKRGKQDVFFGLPTDRVREMMAENSTVNPAQLMLLFKHD